MIVGVRVALIGGVALLTAGLAVAQSGSGDPAANWGQIAACARLDTAERHACMDNVLRATGLLDRGREVAEQRESFGQQQRRDPPAATPPPAATRPPAAVAAPPPAVPPVLEELATTVARAFDPGNHLMVIITQEGQVWQQNESKDLGLPPRPGTRFVVEKGALGSFNCRIGGGRTFRCRRHD